MLWWFAQNSVGVALLTVSVALVCWLFRPRPAVCHLLWLVVLLKFLTPPFVAWPWPAGPPLVSWFDWLSPDLGANLESRASTAVDTLSPRPDEGRTTSSFAIKPRNHDSIQHPIVQLPGPTSEATAAPYDSSEPDLSIAASSAFEKATTPASRSPVYMTGPVPESRVFPLNTIANGLLFAWLLGTIVVAGHIAWRIVRWHGRIRRAEPVPGRIRRQVCAVSRMMRAHPPNAIIVGERQSPMIWCSLRPKLLWPRSLCGKGQGGRWRGVLAHELAHIRRGDTWIAWLDLAARALWWWNPLYWHVRRQLHQSAEMACDAWAVACSGDRRAYAESLLTISTLMSGKSPAPAALAASVAARSNFERRLSMILSQNVNSRLSARGILAALVLGMVAIPGWSAQPPAPKDPLSPVPALSTNPAAATPAVPQATPPATPHEIAAELPKVRAAWLAMRKAGRVDPEQAEHGITVLADLLAHVRQRHRSPEVQIQEVYLFVLQRRPDVLELAAAEKQLRQSADEEKHLTDLARGLLNTKEFLQGSEANDEAPPPPDRVPGTSRDRTGTDAIKELTQRVQQLEDELAKARALLATSQTTPATTALAARPATAPAGARHSDAGPMQGVGSHLDLVNLATTFADASAALKAAELRQKRIQSLQAHKAVSAEEVDTAEIAADSARRKFSLLTEIVTAALEDAKAQATVLEKFYGRGFTTERELHSAKSKVRILEIILKSGQ